MRSFESAENYAKFWLNPVALVQSVGYNATELRRLRELIEKHHNLFQEKRDECCHFRAVNYTS
jgi:hypothetical protein